MNWFDAHLDLAMLAVHGRDMTLTPHAASTPEFKAGLTLPSLSAGHVRLALGTIFTEPNGTGPEGYPAENVDRAYAVGRAQLEVYLTWRDRNLISLDGFAALRATSDLAEIRGGMGVAESVPLPPAARLARLPKSPPLQLGILMENADPIRSPAEIQWWKDRGLVAVGLCWASPSRYATGNRAARTDGGLTGLGKEMVREMDRLDIIHDASHLSDRSFADLCEATDGLIVASHSNCRAITDPTGQNQRHLTDAQIKEIARRGGVIGLNLFSMFLRPNWEKGAAGGRATIADCINHIEHICDLSGSRNHIALGSDMDGGFPADQMPEGINSPANYPLLSEGLSARNWSDADIAGFAVGNWLRIFG